MIKHALKIVRCRWSVLGEYVTAAVNYFFYTLLLHRIILKVCLAIFKFRFKSQEVSCLDDCSLDCKIFCGYCVFLLSFLPTRWIVLRNIWIRFFATKFELAKTKYIISNSPAPFFKIFIFQLNFCFTNFIE